MITIKERIESWFKERGNKPATLKEVQKAFPDINPKSISETLSGKDKRGRYNFNADYPKDPTSLVHYYSFLPIEEAVKEAVRLATCEGDCSHCEAETCASKDEAKSPKAETKKASIKDRIASWFRSNGNKPATLKEVQAAFPDVNPKSISAALSISTALSKRENFDFFYRAAEYKNGKWRTLYSLQEKYYALPSSSEKPLAEAEIRDAEEEQEADVPSVAASLKSIAKSLAQIAEVETSIAKLFLKKQKS